LKPQNLIGAAFGSYGCSSEAVDKVTADLRELNVELVSEGLKAKYVPDAESLGTCREFGRKVADQVLRRAS
jgi:flavorubredoxin